MTGLLRHQRLIVISALLAFTGWLSWWYLRPTVGERLRLELREAIPVGSEAGIVDEWAAQHRVPTKRGRFDNANGTIAFQSTLLATAGLSEEEAKSYIEIMLPLGRAIIGGQWVRNQAWVFITLDASGQVKGQYVLTLQELAVIEQQRR